MNQPLVSPSTPVRVLVVDDSRQSREFLTDYVLTPNGYQPIVAQDGAEGLEKILAERPDIILLDYEMPRMNGLQVLQAMRERRIEIPVILMTAHGSEQVAVEVFRLGVRDYIIKPFEVDQMLTILDRALVEARLRRERDALLVRLQQANQLLERRLQELNMLYGIGKSVTTMLERENLLTRIVDAAVLITNADAGALVLVDRATGRLTHKTIREATEQTRAHRAALVLAEWEKMAFHVVKTHQPVVTRATLCAPLLFSGQLLGVLGCINSEPDRSFTQHEHRLLQMLADYATIALENARLFQELEAQKEQEKAQIRRLFERYVAPAVVERLMANPAEVRLGGVSQTVTILFADIRGFTTISRHLPAGVLVEILNQHISIAAQAVLNEEGTLDKFMGDAVMAFFNAPLPQPDHAWRAVRAAMAMQRTLQALHQKLPESYRLHFGIGLSTGEAIVGNIGTPQQMNYTVIGDCVNLAQRLQAEAKGGQIFMEQCTYQAVQNQVRVKPLGLRHLKGLGQPEAVFELLGMR